MLHALFVASLALLSVAAQGQLCAPLVSSALASSAPTSWSLPTPGSPSALGPIQADSLTPDAKNLATWADFIRPNAEELKYESIGWRNAFWPAVQEARKLGRPILLWTMNGHPLGCT
jgi:hypothetical protein